LAVADLGGVEGWEPDDELPVAVAGRLVADVGGEHATVPQEPAAAGLGRVGRSLGRGGELADLPGAERADLLALQREDPPALRRGCAGGGRPPRATRDATV